MGLLANVISWAVGNYSAGAFPWSGTPMRVKPADAFLTPEVTRPTEYDNYLYGSIIDTVNALNNTAAGMYASNFPNWTPTEDSQMNADYVRVGGSAYLGITGQTVWLAMGGEAGFPSSGSNTMTVLGSFDGGQTFQNLNLPSTGIIASSSGAPYGITGDYAGGYLFTYNKGGSTGIVAYYSSSWNVGTAGPPAVGTAVPHFDSTNGVYFWGIMSGADASILTVPLSSTTYTQHVPTGVPSGVSSVTSSIIVQKGDGTFVHLPATQTGTVWAHSAAYSSPTSTTPTYGTFPVANTDVITAGDYSPGDAQYMVAQYNGSSATHFLRSSDGITWAAATGSILGQIVGLAVIASRVWVALRNDYLMYYSTDTGETWTPCVNKLAGDVNQFHGFKSNALKNQIAAFGSYSYKNQSTPTESRMMLTSLISG